MFDVTILTVIPELKKDDFDALLCHVSPEKRERIGKFRFFRDARNCLLGDILARTVICRATGLNGKQLEFFTNAFGKPFIADNPYIHFNISHAGCYVACVISDEPVGIDIELTESPDMQVAKRFFAPDEIAYIANDDSAYRFYEVWTKKESRIKWEGKGLHKPLQSFSVFEENEPRRAVYHKVLENREVVCHVCSAKLKPPTVRTMNTQAFINDEILTVFLKYDTLIAD